MKTDEEKLGNLLRPDARVVEFLRKCRRYPYRRNGDFRGEKTVHTQTMSGENCDAFLSKLREMKTKKRRVQLTFEDPPFSGYVVEAHCVRPDGSVRAP